jgi:carboxyl-terminal processing protease
MSSKATILAWILCILMYPLGSIAKELAVAEQAAMIVKTAEKYHYAPKPIDDSFSEVVYKSFLHMLDPYGILFTEESIGELDSYKFAIDDQIKQKSITFLEAATSVYAKQLRIADSLVRQAKTKDVDLSAKDTLWIGGDAVYARRCDLDKKWDRWLRYMVLWSYRSDKDSTDTLGLPSPKETLKFLEDVISREDCRLQKKMIPLGGIDKFTGSSYLRAISLAIDPHTQYLSFADKRQFETDLSKESGSFGIRVNFNIIGEIEIVELMPGGPAWYSNKINEGDVILDIRKTDGSLFDLRCATLSDVEDFLSSIGYKQVIFRIRKKNGQTISVPLKKEILDVEKNTIRSYVLKGSKSIGYIYLPSFYTDFYYGAFFSKGSANDLAKELIKLKSTAIDGIILDLRSNGGGSLREAIRMAGVFIDNGALSITHSRGQDPEILKDNARGTIYSGPLVVLTNSSSASAAELLTGVLQDYNRAVIVGSRTFGKGTIQEVLPVNAGDFDSLSRYKGDPPGWITLTTGSFYRVTGDSHQKVGISPEIELPELFEGAQDREASYDGALEFKNIKKKTYYYPLDSFPISKLKKLSDTRIRGSSAFSLIRKSEELSPKANCSYPIPLAFNSFTEYIRRFDNLEDSLKVDTCPFSAVLPEAIKIKSSMTEQEKTETEDIIRDLQDDIYINEAFNIMNDLIQLSVKKEGN